MVDYQLEDAVNLIIDAIPSELHKSENEREVPA
jgi:hypothetical protein